MAWLGWESGKTKDGSIGQGEYLRIVKKFQEKLLTTTFASPQCRRTRLPGENVPERPVRGLGGMSITNGDGCWLSIYFKKAFSIVFLKTFIDHASR
jgi:hypothetical protein